MSKVIACIDDATISKVCDASLWASKKTKTDLLLLHVLEKHEKVEEANLSGSFGVDGREHLLEQLTALDEQRSRVALESGKHMLAQAKDHAKKILQADNIECLQRHGSLVETVQELEQDTLLVTIGINQKHGIGSHLDNITRTIKCPILIATREFSIPKAFILALDGSKNSDRVLDSALCNPLLQDLECHVVMVAEATEKNQEFLHKMASRIEKSKMALLQGDVAQALKDYQGEHSIDLIAMGAYGHSRIREFFVGSNTIKVIEDSQAALLLLR